MPNYYQLATILLILSLIFACSRSEEESASKSTPSERPTAEDFMREQPSIGQDLSEAEGDFDDVDEVTADPVPRPDLSHINSTEPIRLDDRFSLIGTYTGTLPCADCSGIEHELSLFEDDVTNQRRYTLKRTYKHTRSGDRVFWNAGPWRVSTASGNQQVFDLSFNNAEERIRFEVASQRVIRLLDREGEDIESQHNYSLYRLPG